MIGSLIGLEPTAGAIAAEAQEAMQEVVAGVGIGFDVVDQHPRRLGQVRQGGAGVAAQGLAALLHLGLGNQLRSHLAQLFAMHGQGVGQLQGVGRSQVAEALQAQLLQQLAPLAADATHLTEVPFGGGFAVAEAAPAAEHAFLAVVDQGRRAGALQIAGQALQAFIELVLEAAAQGQGLPLLAGPHPRQHQPMANRRLLGVPEQAAPEGEGEAGFAAEAIALAGQHGLVGIGTPTALAGAPHQQGWMGLQGQTGGPDTGQPHPHHRGGTRLTGGQAMAGPLGAQAGKTAALAIELEAAVGTPDPFAGIAMAIEPGPPFAPQPAPQEPIGERGRGQGGNGQGKGKGTGPRAWLDARAACCGDARRGGLGPEPAVACRRAGTWQPHGPPSGC